MYKVNLFLHAFSRGACFQAYERSNNFLPKIHLKFIKVKTLWKYTPNASNNTVL